MRTALLLLAGWLLLRGAAAQTPASTAAQPAAAQPLLEQLRLKLPSPAQPAAAPARPARPPLLEQFRLKLPAPTTPAQLARPDRPRLEPLRLSGSAATPPAPTSPQPEPGCVAGACDNCFCAVDLPGQRWTGRWHYGVFLEGTMEIFGGVDSLRYGRVTVGRFDKPLPASTYRYAEASFVPLGTHEAIAGFINNAAYDFEPDMRYFATDAAGATVARADAPRWLREVYVPRYFREQRQRAAAEARRVAAEAERTRLAQQAAYEAAHPPARPATYDNAPASRSYIYQPTDHEVTCGSCGGAGWVSGQSHAYGQSVSTSYDGRTQCHSCGGRGKTTSRY